MDYYCADCGRDIKRNELESADRLECPKCGSYSIRKGKNE